MDMRKLLNLMESAIKEESFDIEDYANDSGEASTYKGIPIKFRDHPDVLNTIKDKNLRVKYRGPSTPDYKRPQSHTIRDKATSFALYKKDIFDDPESRAKYVDFLKDMVHQRARYGNHTKQAFIRNKALELIDKLAQKYPDVEPTSKIKFDD